MSYINIVLNILPTLYEGHIVSVHRMVMEKRLPTLNEDYIVSVHGMVMEKRPVDPGSIQGSHRPISFIRKKQRTRANDILCKTEY